MKLKLKWLPGSLMILIILVQNEMLAQDHWPEHHQEHIHQHGHPANEIGAGNFISYLASENAVAYGLHIHYLRSIRDSRFGFGLGYEHIFDEHAHRTLGLIATCRVLPPIVLSLAPGILFPNQEDPDARIALHSELVYEFEINHFHIGPSLEFSTTFEEFHIGAGIHIGFAF